MRYRKGIDILDEAGYPVIYTIEKRTLFWWYTIAFYLTKSKRDEAFRGFTT